MWSLVDWEIGTNIIEEFERECDLVGAEVREFVEGFKHGKPVGKMMVERLEQKLLETLKEIQLLVLKYLEILGFFDEWCLVPNSYLKF